MYALPDRLVPTRIEIIGTEALIEEAAVGSDAGATSGSGEDDGGGFSTPVKARSVRLMVGREVSRILPSDHFGLIAEFTTTGSDTITSSSESV